VSRSVSSAIVTLAAEHALAAEAGLERMAYLMPVVEPERAQLPQELVGHLREKRRQLGLIRAMRAR